MSANNSIQTTIIESYTKDVGRGRIRVNSKVMKVLKLVENDIVLIKGTRTTVARALPLYPTEQNKDFCRTDGLIRINAGISKGDSAIIQKIDSVEAQHIIVAPIESWPPIDERYLADVLEGIPLRINDNGMIPYFGSRLTFQVLEINPKSEGAIVTQKTVLEIKEIEKPRKTIDENKNLEYVTRRVFSLLQELKEVENYSETERKNMLITIYNNVKELLDHSKNTFPNNDFIPQSIRSFEEIEKISGINGVSQYIKSLIRQIADALDIKHLEILSQKTILGADIFVVHGHDEAIKEKVARFIEKIELKPVILHEQPNRGRTIIEKFEDYASKIGFAVVILTPDDISIVENEKGKKIEEKRARQNVILELGFFIGAIGRKRTCVLYQESVRIPSDYEGVLYIPIDKSDAWKLSLAKEIKQAGIPVDLNKII